MTPRYSSSGRDGQGNTIPTDWLEELLHDYASH